MHMIQTHLKTYRESGECVAINIIFASLLSQYAKYLICTKKLPIYIIIKTAEQPEARNNQNTKEPKRFLIENQSIVRVLSSSSSRQNSITTLYTNAVNKHVICV